MFPLLIGALAYTACNPLQKRRVETATRDDEDRVWRRRHVDSHHCH